MLKVLLITTLLSFHLHALTVEEFNNQQMESFNSYKKSQEDGFKEYKKSQTEAFEDYKKEIERYWDKPKLSTKKTWILYTEDQKTRTDVDFSKETITIETIAHSEKEAKIKLKAALAQAVVINTKKVQEIDPLEKKLALIKKPNRLKDSQVKAESILSTVIFNNRPTKKLIYSYVNKNISNSNIRIKKSKKLKNQNIYSVKIQMPKDAMLKRSKVYQREILKHSKIQKLPTSLVFAIMHTESNFNPRARSHIPAYGLMQIVPKSAGVDAHKYLYNTKRIVSGTYLYDSSNNITMGTAYLHILYYRYLKKIKNPTSRLYCTIAAYNTGAGNIAWAFTKSFDMNKAAPLINKMQSEQVYSKLLKDLRWDEPKKYLINVSKRMKAYRQVYGG